MPPEYVLTLVINIAVSTIYGVLILRDWRRQSPSLRKVQILNTGGIIVALGFAQYFLAGYLYNMTQVTWSIPVVPLPWVFITLPVVPGTIAVVLRIIKPKTPERVERLQGLLPPRSPSPQVAIRRDILRKGTHVMMFVAIFIIDVVGFYIILVLFKDPFSIRRLHLEAWGYGDGDYILFAWAWEDWLGPKGVIAASRVIVFGVLYFLTLFMLTGELCRHSQRWRFVFEKTVYRTLRPRELDRIGAYALFAAGFLLACVFLPYFGILGMLAGWSLGDLAASQVGMRWGRHQFLHQDKSWEGTIAGAFISFAAAWPFLGFAWAGAFTAAFVATDLLTEKPIPMSDNILLPIVGVVVFSILQAVGIPVDPIFIAIA